MTVTELSELPELGVGLVHSAPLEALLGPRLFDRVIEVEPQTSWRQRGPHELHAPLDAFSALSQQARARLVHGVGDPLGSSLSAGPEFSRAFASSTAAIRPAWVSEHLAFNRFVADDGVHHTGFFMPPVQTVACAQVAAERIRVLADQLDRVVLFETGVSYLRRQPWELSDGEFFAEVAEAADCGILLDLHNGWTNARNHRESLDALVASMPLDRVVELHVAGGVEHRGFWLDAHCGTMPAGLRRFAEHLVPRLPNLKAIVFEVLPQFVDSLGAPAILAELAWLDRLWAVRGSEPMQRSAPLRSCRAAAPSAAVSPSHWEHAIGQQLRGRGGGDALSQQLGNDPGIALYRELVDRFRRGAIAEALPWTLRALRHAGGAEASHVILSKLLSDTTPEPFESTEALRFADALDQLPLSPVVRDALAIERASLRAQLDEREQHIEVAHEPRALFAALARGVDPRSGPTIELTITP